MISFSLKLNYFYRLNNLTYLEKPFKVNNFDLLRIFAATQVLFDHSFLFLKLNPPLWFIPFESFTGGPMFFAISGFLISSSYERNDNLKEYARNRSLRIFPALWSSIILGIILMIVFGHINFFKTETISWIILEFTRFVYTPHFLSLYGLGSFNPSLWTIPVELQFYIVLPILYIIVNKFVKEKKTKNLAFLGIFIFFALVAFIIFTYFYSNNLKLETTVQKVLRYSFVPHIYMFLIGVLMQRYKSYQHWLIYGKGLIWIALYLLAYYLLPSAFIFKAIANILLAISTISLAYTKPGIANKILAGNDISYGIYIYHGIIISLFVQLHFSGTITYLSVFVIAYLLAILSWRFIEKPSLNKKKKTIHQVSV